MDRVPVPNKMRHLLLRKNAGVCCVCKIRNIGVNFHHIDGDASNTVEENMAVLCVRDHDAHHRPEEYRPDAAVNHLDLDRDAIMSVSVHGSNTSVVQPERLVSLHGKAGGIGFAGHGAGLARRSHRRAGGAGARARGTRARAGGPARAVVE